MIEMAAVALHVEDIDRALGFWRDALDLRIRFDTGWASEAPVFGPSGMTEASAVRLIALVGSTPVEGPPGPNQPAGVTLMQFRGVGRTAVSGAFQDPGTIHVAWWVDDLDARVARFEAAGYSLLGPVTPKFEGDGVRLAMIRDPDGFVLELITLQE